MTIFTGAVLSLQILEEKNLLKKWDANDDEN